MNPQKITKAKLLGELKKLQKRVAELNKSDLPNSTPENNKQTLDWQKALFEEVPTMLIFISDTNSKFSMANQGSSD